MGLEAWLSPAAGSCTHLSPGLLDSGCVMRGGGDGSSIVPAEELKPGRHEKGRKPNSPEALPASCWAPREAGRDVERRAWGLTHSRPSVLTAQPQAPFQDAINRQSALVWLIRSGQRSWSWYKGSQQANLTGARSQSPGLQPHVQPSEAPFPSARICVHFYYWPVNK